MRTFHSLPERGDRGEIFVHGDGEAIHLVVVLHEDERIFINVAVEVNVRPVESMSMKSDPSSSTLNVLDAPVPLVLLQQRVSGKNCVHGFYELREGKEGKGKARTPGLNRNMFR